MIIACAMAANVLAHYAPDFLPERLTCLTSVLVSLLAVFMSL